MAAGASLVLSLSRQLQAQEILRAHLNTSDTAGWYSRAGRTWNQIKASNGLCDKQTQRFDCRRQTCVCARLGPVDECWAGCLWLIEEADDGDKVVRWLSCPSAGVVMFIR